MMKKALSFLTALTIGCLPMAAMSANAVEAAPAASAADSDTPVYLSETDITQPVYNVDSDDVPASTTEPMPTTTTTSSATTTTPTSSASVTTLTTTSDSTESTTSYVRSTPYGGISDVLPEELTIHSGETFTLYFDGHYVTSVEAISSDPDIVKAEASISEPIITQQQGTLILTAGDFDGKKTAEVELIYNTFIKEDGGSKTIKITVLGRDMNPNDANDQSFVRVGDTVIIAGMENWIGFHTFLAMDLSLSSDCEYLSFTPDRVLDVINYGQCGPSIEVICDKNAPSCTADITMTYTSLSTKRKVTRKFTVDILSQEDAPKDLSKYKTAIEYDASPMKLGETRAIRFYDPMTGKGEDCSYTRDSDHFDNSYEEGSDTLYITAKAPGEAKLYVHESGTLYGTYAYLTVLDEPYDEGSTTSSTVTAVPESKTVVEWDDSPMKIGEVRALHYYNPALKDTVPKSNNSILIMTSNLTTTDSTYSYYNPGYIKIKATAPGEAKVMILENTCSEAEVITFTVLDEEVEEPEYIPHIKFDRDFYIIEPGETITVNFDIHECELKNLMTISEEITFGEIKVTEEDGVKKGSFTITCSKDAEEKGGSFGLTFTPDEPSDYPEEGANIYIVKDKSVIPENAEVFSGNYELLYAADDKALVFERSGRFSLEGFDMSAVEGVKGGNRLYGFFFYDKDDPDRKIVKAVQAHTIENNNPLMPTRMGDANCDGYVNMADAVLVMQAIGNPDKYGIGLTTGINIIGALNCDVDGSGDVTNMDALMIQRYKLGIVTAL